MESTSAIASPYANPERRRDMARGLRDLAALLESCPDIPAPYILDVLVFPPNGSDTGTRAEIDRIAAILGVTTHDETARHGHYTASKRFGPVTYRAIAISSRSRDYHNARNSYTSNVIPATDEEDLPVNITILILLGVAFLAGVLAGMFVLLVAGVRSDDRSRDIYLAPRNRAESASRWLLVNIRHAGPSGDNEKDT